MNMKAKYPAAVAAFTKTRKLIHARAKVVGYEKTVRVLLDHLSLPDMEEALIRLTPKEDRCPDCGTFDVKKRKYKEYVERTCQECGNYRRSAK